MAAIYLTFMVSVQNSSFISSSSKVEENEAITWMREAFMNGGSSKHFFTIYDGDNYLVWKRASDSPESRMRLRFVLKNELTSYESRYENMPVV